MRRVAIQHMCARRLPADILGTIARIWHGRALSATCRELKAIAPDPAIWADDTHTVCDCGCVPASRMVSARLPNGVVHGNSIISCGANYVVEHSAWHQRDALVGITSRVHGHVYARVDVVGSRLYEWFAFSKQAFMRRGDETRSIWTDVSQRDYDRIIDRAIDRDNRRPARPFAGHHICEVGCIALLPQCVF